MTIENIISFIIGYVASLAAAISWKTINIFLPIFKLRKSSFKIKGFWISSNFLSSDKMGYSIELIKIRQRREEITFIIDNYNSARSEILRLHGKGMYRNSYLCAYYYFPRQINPEIGCLTLKARASNDGFMILEGIYAQYIDREHVIEREVKVNQYRLKPLRVNIYRQFRLLFGKSLFKDYREVHSLVTEENQ